MQKFTFIAYIALSVLYVCVHFNTHSATHFLLYSACFIPQVLLSLSLKLSDFEIEPKCVCCKFFTCYISNGQPYDSFRFCCLLPCLKIRGCLANVFSSTLALIGLLIFITDFQMTHIGLGVTQLLQIVCVCVCACVCTRANSNSLCLLVFFE